jgi:hypothetical protein
LEENYLDGTQRDNGYYSKYEVPQYVSDSDARNVVQIRPYLAIPSKEIADCPLKIEAYFWNPLEGDWEEIRNKDG